MAVENDKRHAHGGLPSLFLEEIFRGESWAVKPGRALDVATGEGRNALYLAARGFRVDAIDHSSAALAAAREAARAKHLEVNFIEADLERADLPAAAYDLIVNFNYLDRALVPKIKNALKPGGRVVFETFLVDQKEIGHPKNPDYLLVHNELLDLFRDFRVLYYREGKFTERGVQAYKAGLFAEKPE